MRRKEITIPTVIGLLIAVVGLVSGLVLLRNRVGDRVGAATEETPKEVKVTNVTDTSFTVSWMTDQQTSGFVQYGLGNEIPDLVVADERDQAQGSIRNTYTHYVVIRGLRAGTDYGFKIGSGKAVYDQSGQPYRITTGPALTNPPAADVAYGTILTAANNPAEGAIVYYQLPGAYLQSALVKASGSWLVSLSNARSTNLTSFATYDKSSTEAQVYVQGAVNGTSTVKLATNNDSPAPEITLGSSTLGPTVTNTDATTTSPAPAAPGTSKFTSDSLAGGTEAGPVQILTPKFNEQVGTTQPQISGVAPAGSQVTIEIHSETQISTTVVTGADGKFTYNVPTGLAPGPHTVTVSTLVNGILQTVSRSFVVYAADDFGSPYYTATPSASISPKVTTTITPTPKITGTVTPKVTAKVTPTITIKPSVTVKPSITTTPMATLSGTLSPTPTLIPRVTNPSEDPKIPISGNEDLTILLTLAGAALVIGGGWWYKRMA